MSTILAIDDNNDNLVVIQAILRQMMPDAQLIKATSGMVGLRMARTERPDVILLDIIMPEMDGYETCSCLRHDPLTKDIPVIVLTAVNTDSEGRIKALESGADAFLTKPIEAAELVAQIRSMLRIKLAEDKLRGERNLLQKAVMQTNESIVITDRNLRVHYVNPAFERHSGFTSQQIVGQELPVLDTTQNPAHIQQVILDCLGRGEVWSGQLVNKRKNGELYEAEASFSPIHGDDGSVTGYLMVERDVTARNHMEQQLRQAQKMEALGTLAGGIAHDFNNVLSVIMGYAELTVLELPPESDTANYMAEVTQAGKRARELIGQILTFSRRQEQKMVPMQLSTIAKEVLKMLKVSLPATITVKADICAKGAITADPTKMHQVILNLCTNAFHAMQDTGGELEVTLHDLAGEEIPPSLRDKAKHMLYLMIRDTGPGIPEQIREKIFEPYFTTKKPGEGTGLGLSIAHSIISDMNGSIVLESETGVGTTFHIYIPENMEQIAKEKLKSAYTPRHQGVRLMLVDDELPLVRMHKRLMSRIGYVVNGFTDPLEALKAFDNAPNGVDVLITDLTMPNMNGLQLTRTVHKQRPDLCVLLISGFFDKLEPEDAKAAGIFRMLRKPISTEKLAQAIDDCIDAQQNGKQ